MSIITNINVPHVRTLTTSSPDNIIVSKRSPLLIVNQLISLALQSHVKPLLVTTFGKNLLITLLTPTSLLTLPSTKVDASRSTRFLTVPLTPQLSPLPPTLTHLFALRAKMASTSRKTVTYAQLVPLSQLTVRPTTHPMINAQCVTPVTT